MTDGKRRFVWFATLLGALLLAAPAGAACTPQTRGPIAPSADTYANANNPGVNYGSAYAWASSNIVAPFGPFGSNQTMTSYVRYPLPPIPAGCTLSRATLRLKDRRNYVLVVKTFPAQYPAPIYMAPAGSSWGEHSLTWKNQPDPGTPNIKITGQMLKDSWTVTPVVASLYANGNTGIETFALKPQSWYSPNSREYLAKYGNRGIPYLFVSYQ